MMAWKIQSLGQSPWSAVLTALCLVGALSGCGDDGDSGQPVVGDEDNNAVNNEQDPDEQEQGLTFWQDVAPVLDASCMSCHRTGGVAPFTFETYEEVKTWGPAIVASTKARTMPPWLVTGDGTCGDWSHNEWLSDEALAALEGWVDGGMLEGTPGERNPAEGISMQTTHDFMTPEFSPVRLGTPEAEFDEYRCFLVEMDDLDETRFLTGYEVFPGNEAIVHHVIANFVDPNAESGVDGMTNAERMAQLDAESPDRLGWPCFAQAGPGVEIESDPIAWAPGQGAVSLPEGTGIPIEAGNVMVVQMHYNLIDDAQIGSSDVSRVALRLEESVETTLIPFYMDYLLAFGDVIPAGETAYDYTRGFSLGDIGVPINIKLWGMMPHMHSHGVKLKASIRSESAGDDAVPQCLAEVNNWDYDWQRVYWYNEPVTLTPDDIWEISCTFDTSNTDQPVSAGWGTQNEMCLTVVYVSL